MLFFSPGDPGSMGVSGMRYPYSSTRGRESIKIGNCPVGLQLRTGIETLDGGGRKLPVRLWA